MPATIRPLTLADVPAVSAVYDAAEAVDDTGEHYNLDDHEEEFANPDLDLARDSFAMVDGDTLLGYSTLLVRKDEGERKAYVFGVTDPRHRGQGVASALLERLMARASEVANSGEGDLRLIATAQMRNEGQVGVLSDLGFAPERWNFVMRHRLDDVDRASEIPEGYAVRTYTPDDAEPWRETHNRAFLDHPNFSRWDASEWEQWVTASRAFRPDLTWLVTPQDDPATIVAYLQTNEYDAFQEATGKREAFVAKVGTVPEHRGRGLAGALLRFALARYVDAGYDESSLDVDSENPSGALGIYQRAGFETERTFASFEKVLRS